MDLLFAIIFIASAIAAVIAAVSFVAMPFQPVLWAIRSATVFVIGAVSGVALSGGLLFLFVGTGSKLTSTLQVYAYLSSLALGGLLGGCLLLWLFIKTNRSNPSFKRDWLKPAP